MKSLLAVFITIYAITFSATPALGAGWFWDIGGGLGFAAFAGLLLLVVTGARPRSARPHQRIAYAVLFITAAHAFWYFLGDAAVVEHLKPGAPGHMWSALTSLGVLVVLMTIALPPDRQRVHRSRTGFRYWHRALAVAVIATAAYHAAGSGFYLDRAYQLVLVSAVALVVCLGTPLWSRLAAQPPGSALVFLLCSITLALLFATLRNIPT